MRLAREGDKDAAIGRAGRFPADLGALRAKLLRDFPANEVRSESRLREQSYGAAADRRVLMEQDEVWTTGKRHFDMTAYWQWRERQPRQAPLF